MKMRYYVEKATGNLISTPNELPGYKYQEVDPAWYADEVDRVQQANNAKREWRVKHAGV